MQQHLEASAADTLQRDSERLALSEARGGVRQPLEAQAVAVLYLQRGRVAQQPLKAQAAYLTAKVTVAFWCEAPF